MALPLTRTHTVYFTPDTLIPLATEIEALRANAEKRRPYISETAWASIDMRLVLLETGLQLLTDRAA